MKFQNARGEGRYLRSSSWVACGVWPIEPTPVVLSLYHYCVLPLDLTWQLKIT